MLHFSDRLQVVMAESRSSGDDEGMKNADSNTHSKTIGYLLWLVGFTGAHRFYYGKPISGTIWFFTLGLLGVGWIIDLFLIPGMDRQADLRFVAGPVDYSVAWLLLTFLGLFGVHRFYLGKWGTGLLYLLTGGLLFIGCLYDYWTLNTQISEINHAAGR
jgi:TM2 domain-containing membrane protein YozV